MRRLVILVILASCSKDSATETARPESPEPVEAAPSASRPRPAPAPVAEAAWRWHRSKSDPEFMSSPDLVVRADEVYNVILGKLVRGGARMEVRRLGHGNEVVWSYELDMNRGHATAMALAGDRLIVAHHNHLATGCRLYAFDTATGEIVWQTGLIGVGSVAHSKYRNRVQLRVDGDRAIVYGWESAGRYVEVVDVATGKTLANHRPSDELAAIEWQWQTPERKAFRSGPTSISARGGGSFDYRPAELPQRAELARTDAAGKELWRVEIDGEGKCGNAAMLELGDALYAVHYCSIATGARLYVIDSATGELRIDQRLEGLGPIGHSEYWNDVEIRSAQGQVVVFGKEAAGRYIEARDSVTGALASSQVFLDR